MSVCGCKLVGAYDMDKILEWGKKVLPTPAVLFFAHIVYATVCSLIYVLNMILYDNGWAQWCGASYWTIYVLWIFAVLLSLLLALAKHKESGDILITILSFFAFWATLFGLQSAPFYCYADSKAGSIVRTILRAVIDVMLTIIYLLWSKEEIMAIISK
ncbi:hypothetical protein ACHWQZ_G001154 [Mnemiopsis leidyi]